MDAPEIERNTANLLASVVESNWAAAEAALKLPVDPNSRDKTGRSLFHICCEHGNFTIAALLLQKGADIEARFNFGRTALHCAGEAGRDSVLDFLIKYGADLEAKDNVGRTVLARVSYKGYLSLALKLLDAGASMDSRDDTGSYPLHSACEKGHTHITSLLLERGSNINCQDSFGRSPLHLACLYDHLDTVTWLCERGAALDIFDVDGRTPLHVASFKDHTEIVAYLLEAGANIECKSNDGRTPLHSASAKGHTETIYCLLDHGANSEACDGRGQSALLCACESGQLEAASILLDRGADIEATDASARTALLRACEKGQWRVAGYLRDRGAVLGAGWAAVDSALRRAHFSPDRPCVTPRSEDDPVELLLIACAEGNESLVRSLLQEENCPKPLSLIEKYGRSGLNALHSACANGQLGICSVLLDNGADIEARTKERGSRTPLHCAAENGHVDVAYALLNRTADVDALTSDGKTALFLVCDWDPEFSSVKRSPEETTVTGQHGRENCFNRHVELACALLEFGASPTLRPVERAGPCLVADLTGSVLLHRALVQCAYLSSFDEGYFISSLLLLLRACPAAARVRNKASQLPLHIALENDASVDVVGPLLELSDLRKADINSVCRSALNSSWCSIDSLHFLLYSLQPRPQQNDMHIHICGESGVGKTTLRHSLSYFLINHAKKKVRKDVKGNTSHARNGSAVGDLELEPVSSALSWLTTMSPSKRVRPIVGRTEGVNITTFSSNLSLPFKSDVILKLHDYAGREYFRPIQAAFLSKPDSLFILVVGLQNFPESENEAVLGFQKWLHYLNGILAPTSGPAACVLVVINSREDTDRSRIRRLKDMLNAVVSSWTGVAAWPLIKDRAPEQMQIPESRSGFLLRQGETSKSWRKRYYVLNKGVLYYFDSDPNLMPSSGTRAKGNSFSGLTVVPEHSPQPPVGTLFLLDYSIERLSERRLLLRNMYRKQRELLLESDEGDCDAWTTAFQSHFLYLKNFFRLAVLDPVCLDVSLTSDVSTLFGTIQEACRAALGVKTKNVESAANGQNMRARCVEHVLNEYWHPTGHGEDSEADALPPVITVESFKSKFIIPAIRQLRSDCGRVDECVFSWLSSFVVRRLEEAGVIALAHNDQPGMQEMSCCSGFAVTDVNWVSRDILGLILCSTFEIGPPLPMQSAQQLNTLTNNAASQFLGDVNVLPQLLSQLRLCIQISDIVGPYVPQQEELIISGSSAGTLLFPMFVDLPADEGNLAVMPLTVANGSGGGWHSHRIIRRFKLPNGCEFPAGYFPTLFTMVAELEHNTRDIVITSQSLCIQRCYAMSGTFQNMVQIILALDRHSADADNVEDEREMERQQAAKSFTITITTRMLHIPSGCSYASRRMQSISGLVCSAPVLNGDSSQPEFESIKGKIESQKCFGLQFGWLRHVGATEYGVHPLDSSQDQLLSSLQSEACCQPHDGDNDHHRSRALLMLNGCDENGCPIPMSMKASATSKKTSTTTGVSSTAQVDSEAFFDILEQLN